MWILDSGVDVFEEVSHQSIVHAILMGMILRCAQMKSDHDVVLPQLDPLELGPSISRRHWPG